MFHRLFGRKTIGWREWISLPELDVDFIKAKVDTGAKTSVLHADGIKIVRKGEKRYVRFIIYPSQRSSHQARPARALLVEKRVIRSSSGHESKRPVIRTQIKIGNQMWPIEVTLVDRAVMGFRMLLGRQALHKRFVVDPAHSFLIGNRPPRSLEPELKDGDEADDYY